MNKTTNVACHVKLFCIPWYKTCRLLAPDMSNNSTSLKFINFKSVIMWSAQGMSIVTTENNNFICDPYLFLRLSSSALLTLCAVCVCQDCSRCAGSFCTPWHAPCISTTHWAHREHWTDRNRHRHFTHTLKQGWCSLQYRVYMTVLCVFVFAWGMGGSGHLFRRVFWSIVSWAYLV